MENETHFAEQEVTEARERLTRRIDKISAQLTPLGLVSAFFSDLQADTAAKRPGPGRSGLSVEQPHIPTGKQRTKQGLKDWVVENPVAAGLATMAVGAIVASVLLSKSRDGATDLAEPKNPAGD